MTSENRLNSRKTDLFFNSGDMQLTAMKLTSRNEKRRKDLTLFCLPGGGSSRDFFDLAPDYSFVDRMLEFGFDLIVMDHPGTATNKFPEGFPFFPPWTSAEWMLRCLRAWTDGEKIVGVGHSMGGMMITLMQDCSAIFDRLVLMGTSAEGLDWGLDNGEKEFRDQPDLIRQNLHDLTLNKFGAAFIENPGGGPSGKSILFGGETPALVERLREISCELYCAGGMLSMMRGGITQEAQRLNVPLFFAFGDHDIGVPPEEAVQRYHNAQSTELLILPDTGHNSLAFSSISLLCDELDIWLRA